MSQMKNWVPNWMEAKARRSELQLQRRDVVLEQTIVSRYSAAIRPEATEGDQVALVEVMEKAEVVTGQRVEIVFDGKDRPSVSGLGRRR